MKKRRMKLLALMLSVVVTATSVAPVSAAGTDTISVAEQETVSEATEQDEFVEATEPVTETEPTTPETEPTTPETPDVEEPAPEEPKESVVKGDRIGTSNWTKETVLEGEEGSETVKEIIYRQYDDAGDAEAAKLLKTWKWEKAAKAWTSYTEDSETADEKKEGLYEIGAKEDGTVNEYRLVVEEETGSLIAYNDGYFYNEEADKFEYYKTEEEVTEDAIESAGLMMDFKEYAGLLEIQFEDDDTIYYVYAEEDGSIVKNDFRIVDGVKYVFDEEGICTEPIEGGWKENEKGRWWENADGTYFSNCVKEIDGNWYAFSKWGYVKKNTWVKFEEKWYYCGEDGIAAEGWVKVGTKWYYMEPETAVMLDGWQEIKGKWYYLTPGNGAMKTGWQKISDKWYYFSASGARTSGWQKVSNKWYFMDKETGIMKTGWMQDGTKWYYLNSSGAMQTGWVKVSNKWYYMNGSGVMQTGWVKVSNKWYYLTPGSGVMKTGWYQVNNVWYHSNSSGVMSANKWVGDYYLLGNGAMATNRWVGNYYVGKDGKWIPGYGTVNVDTLGEWELKDGKYYFLQEDGTYAKSKFVAYNKKWYYLNDKGVMLTGWNYVNCDGTQYKLYFTKYGALVQDVSNMVGGRYTLRVNRTRCMLTVFKPEGNNPFAIPVKSFTCSVGLPATPTITGTYYTQAKDRWTVLMGPSWGQYTAQIWGGYFIHSVAGSDPAIYGNHNVSSADYNKLGQPASHGCVRLCVRDAKWIYDRCPVGTRITIGDGYKEPFDKPATIKMPHGPNQKDPTDPN